MSQTYTVRVTGQSGEKAREVTVQSEHPLGAVIDGLERLKVESLANVAGIEVFCSGRG